MNRFLAALARCVIHGKTREIWSLTATVGHLIAKRRELEARLADVEAGWREDRRTLAHLQSQLNLARDIDAGLACPDRVPEEWTS